MPEKHPRQVRSFVKRAGRLTTSQSRALEVLWPQLGLAFQDEPLQCEAVFGRCAPLVLEIGFGNGETLVEQAIHNPQNDYLGIEVHDPGIGHCLLAAEAGGISNLRLIAHDAVDVLRHQIADDTLARINLYFPDPWPKKRHHKRRLIQPTFLALAAQKLSDQGALHIATDWANYAEHIDEVCALDPCFDVAERVEHGGDQAIDRPGTKFERRGLRKGHRIWDWRLTKVPAD